MSNPTQSTGRRLRLLSMESSLKGSFDPMNTIIIIIYSIYILYLYINLYLIRVENGTYIGISRGSLDFCPSLCFHFISLTSHHIFRFLVRYFPNDFPIYFLWLIAYPSLLFYSLQ